MTDISQMPNISSHDELKDILNLIQLLVSKVNVFGQGCRKTEKQLREFEQHYEELNTKCKDLEQTVNRLRQEKCSECPKLRKQLSVHKKRVSDVESRLKSIGQILNLSQGSNGLPGAYNIATEMLSQDLKREKRQLDDSNCDDELLDNDEFFETSSDKLISDADLSQKTNSATPKKQKIESSNTVSPVMYKKKFEKRNFSLRSSNSPQKKENSSSGRVLKSLPVNTYQIKQKHNNGAVLQEICDNSCNSDKDNASNIADNITETKIWSLKKSHEELPNRKNKLKQTKLSVCVEKKQDISKMPEFNGGIQKCVPTIMDENSFGAEILQETIFDPQTTSTEKFNENCSNIENLDSKDKSKRVQKNEIKENNYSYDRLKQNYDDIPYKYRRDPIRKRNELKQLPGQDCQYCYKFYENKADDFSTSQLQAIKDKCSRHRDKYPIRCKTPPGFWNPRFDDSENSDLSQIANS